MAPGVPGGFASFTEALLRWLPLNDKQNNFGQSTAKLLLLICGIRFGKSDVAAARLLHRMFFTRDGRFLNASFSQDQANIVVERAIALATSGPMAGFVLKVVRSPYLTLVLKNGATLQARSTADANLLRGRAYHGVNMDEGAFAKRTDADVLLGRVIDYAGWVSVTSTPPLVKNWLFEWWVRAMSEQMKGDPRSFAVTGTTYDNPLIPREEIEGLKARYTDLGFLREVMGEFVDNEGATFPMAVVDRVFLPYQPEVSPRLGKSSGNPIGQYLDSWDFGRKTTLTVGHTWDLSGRRYPGLKGRYGIRGVARQRLHGEPWPVQARKVSDTQAYWTSEVCGDSTGVGDVVIGFLECAMTGILFNPKSRGQMILETQKAFQTPGAIVIPDTWHELRTQLLLHTWAEDSEGQTWDDFDSLILGVHHAVNTHRTLGFSVVA